jgi:hypothetical protein
LNKKISFHVLISFLIAFSILVIVLYTNYEKPTDLNIETVLSPAKLDAAQKKFYSQHFDPHEKKIFIFGSSFVAALDSIYIDEYLAKNNQSYHTYNLAISNDQPKKRLNTIDMIINAKPEIVVYGIGVRDLLDQNKTKELPLNERFPDPHAIFAELFLSLENYFNYDLDFLKSPRLGITKIIGNVGDVLPERSKPVLHPLNHPLYFFIDSRLYDTRIATDIQLQNQRQIPYVPYDIDPPDKSKNLIALKKIIHELRKNDIDVVVFVTPFNKYHLEQMTKYETESFNSILQNLSSESNITIYSLYDKYSDLPVWRDIDHITGNKNITIYSNDIAKIILNEIES